MSCVGHDHGYERTYPVINNIVLDSTTSVYYSPNAPIHILVCPLFPSSPLPLYPSRCCANVLITQVGTGGATLDSWMAAVPAWSAHREASFGYTTLQAEPHHLHVKYVRQDRTIGDQFQISKGVCRSCPLTSPLPLVLPLTLPSLSPSF